MAQGHQFPSLWLRHPAPGDDKVTVTQPDSAAGMSCSAAVVAKSRPWLEKQMQDGLSLSVGEGTGAEDGLRAGVCQGKGYFWQRWFVLLAGPMRSRDEWVVTFEAGDDGGCVGSRTPRPAPGLSATGAKLCLITWHCFNLIAFWKVNAIAGHPSSGKWTFSSTPSNAPPQQRSCCFLAKGLKSQIPMPFWCLLACRCLAQPEAPPCALATCPLPWLVCSPA